MAFFFGFTAKGNPVNWIIHRYILSISLSHITFTQTILSATFLALTMTRQKLINWETNWMHTNKMDACANTIYHRDKTSASKSIEKFMKMKQNQKEEKKYNFYWQNKYQCEFLLTKIQLFGTWHIYYYQW